MKTPQSPYNKERRARSFFAPLFIVFQLLIFILIFSLFLRR